MIININPIAHRSSYSHWMPLAHVLFILARPAFDTFGLCFGEPCPQWSHWCAEVSKSDEHEPPISCSSCSCTEHKADWATWLKRIENSTKTTFNLISLSSSNKKFSWNNAAVEQVDHWWRQRECELVFSPEGAREMLQEPHTMEYNCICMLCVRITKALDCFLRQGAQKGMVRH